MDAESIDTKNKVENEAEKSSAREAAIQSLINEFAGLKAPEPEPSQASARRARHHGHDHHHEVVEDRIDARRAQLRLQSIRVVIQNALRSSQRRLRAEQLEEMTDGSPSVQEALKRLESQLEKLQGPFAIEDVRAA